VVCGRINRLTHNIDVDTLEKMEAEGLQFNEIGEVQIDLHNPIFGDPYERNRVTGSFIVVDPQTNDTVAAGMILQAAPTRGAEDWTTLPYVPALPSGRASQSGSRVLAALEKRRSAEPLLQSFWHAVYRLRSSTVM
jgi:sulfate adenylyltransferase subunit 1 (EFTu-like GTPase family)